MLGNVGKCRECREMSGNQMSRNVLKCRVQCGGDLCWSTFKLGVVVDVQMFFVQISWSILSFTSSLVRWSVRRSVGHFVGQSVCRSVGQSLSL